MNNFVLFLCLEDGGSVHALTQFSAEFHSKEAAEAAGKKIIQQMGGYSIRVFTICEKGTVQL
jgi:hypothetical protein